MATTPPDPYDTDDQPEEFSGLDNPPPPIVEPGDPGDAPSATPTKTQT